MTSRNGFRLREGETIMKRFSLVMYAVLFVSFFLPLPAAADQVILDDLIVDGSSCIGFDCVNGESFGFDTIRIKENNLRIKAQDTSTSASFPSNDWQITFNDSSNGGANKFSIDDIDHGRTPFTIEAGAPSHSLFVDDGGRLGLGTSIPVTDIHVKSGNTPTLRLEQDGSSGFTPQTWDVAGNEANFFIRDASNGSTLPIRLRPGAPTSSLDIAATGYIGIGTSSPQARLHIRNADNVRVRYENTNSATNGGVMWEAGVYGGSYTWTVVGTGSNEAFLTPSGDLTIAGSLTTATTNYPDYVFKEDYELMPLSQLEEFIATEKHLPGIPTEEDVKAAGGVNMTVLQNQLLEKVEELTLYTLEQEKVIRDLKARLSTLEAGKNMH